MLTQVGLPVLEGAPGERAARAWMLPAPPDPLGDTRVTAGWLVAVLGAVGGLWGQGVGKRSNAVPSSIPGGPWAGRGLSPGCPQPPLRGRKAAAGFGGRLLTLAAGAPPGVSFPLSLPKISVV